VVLHSSTHVQNKNNKTEKPQEEEKISSTTGRSLSGETSSRQWCCGGGLGHGCLSSGSRLINVVNGGHRVSFNVFLCNRGRRKGLAHRKKKQEKEEKVGGSDAGDRRHHQRWQVRRLWFVGALVGLVRRNNCCASSPKKN